MAKKKAGGKSSGGNNKAADSTPPETPTGDAPEVVASAANDEPSVDELTADASVDELRAQLAQARKEIELLKSQVAAKVR